MRTATRLGVLVLLLFVAGCFGRYGLKERQAFVDAPRNSFMTEQERAAVLEGRIYEGMPKDLLRGSWGPPARINRSVGQYGKREQWVYRMTEKSRCYVYVQDGLVTGWQY